ncbi:helix-turn-helix domain-containing protein [Halobacillus sp. Marseille-Q1614]|uniref:helix-turn-helix domain-containing protein n=1 Tax=Halobacillus sp. Marseille-Q1614 TaxID=2709134 RepID=UPI0015708014|nr:helix-turn-helix transcriptional regulator [Halobacillus sp. Marseille-Q1614]
MPDIGERIRRMRVERGLSINKFAEKAGVSKSYVSNIERGVQKNPSLSVLGKMAATLNVPLEEFLSGSAQAELKKN